MPVALSKENMGEPFTAVPPGVVGVVGVLGVDGELHSIRKFNQDRIIVNNEAIDYLLRLRSNSLWQ